jgi:hypothetical protein
MELRSRTNSKPSQPSAALPFRGMIVRIDARHRSRSPGLKLDSSATVQSKNLAAHENGHVE